LELTRAQQPRAAATPTTSRASASTAGTPVGWCCESLSDRGRPAPSSGRALDDSLPSSLLMPASTAPASHRKTSVRPRRSRQGSSTRSANREVSETAAAWRCHQSAGAAIGKLADTRLRHANMTCPGRRSSTTRDIPDGRRDDALRVSRLNGLTLLQVSSHRCRRCSSGARGGSWRKPSAARSVARRR
jgi:hypothetical protein